MELDEIMAAFADEFGAGKAVPRDDGSYVFDIDEFRVSFSMAEDGEKLLTRSAVADLPVDGRERLFRALLDSPEVGSFALQPGGSRLFLQRIDDIDGLDFEGFKVNLQNFLVLLDNTSRLLADYAARRSDERRAEAVEGREGRSAGWSIQA